MILSMCMITAVHAQQSNTFMYSKSGDLQTLSSTDANNIHVSVTSTLNDPLEIWQGDTRMILSHKIDQKRYIVSLPGWDTVGVLNDNEHTLWLKGKTYTVQTRDSGFVYLEGSDHTIQVFYFESPGNSLRGVKIMKEPETDPLLTLVASYHVVSVFDKQKMARMKSQATRFGIKGGLNSAGQSGTVNSEPTNKGGLLLGFYFDAPLSRVLHIQPEVVYSAQGGKEKFVTSRGSVIGEATTSLSYLNIPVMAKIYIGKVVNLYFGPQFGVLLSGSQEGRIYGEAIDNDIMEIYRTFDLSLCGGLGVETYGGFGFSVRLNYGKTDLYKEDAMLAPGIELPPLSNYVTQFSLNFRLNKL